MKITMLLALLLVGCGGGGGEGGSAGVRRTENVGRYQIVSGAPGSAWRLDTTTGSVAFCQGNTFNVGCTSATDK